MLYRLKVQACHGSPVHEAHSDVSELQTWSGRSDEHRIFIGVFPFTPFHADALLDVGQEVTFGPSGSGIILQKCCPQGIESKVLCHDAGSNRNDFYAATENV